MVSYIQKLPLNHMYTFYMDLKNFAPKKKKRSLIENHFKKIEVFNRENTEKLTPEVNDEIALNNLILSTQLIRHLPP